MGGKESPAKDRAVWEYGSIIARMYPRHLGTKSPWYRKSIRPHLMTAQYPLPPIRASKSFFSLFFLSLPSYPRA